MFVSVFLFIPALLFSILVDNPIPLFLPVLTFLTGLFLIVYNYLFGSPQVYQSQPNESALFGDKTNWSLPYAENVPITNELKPDQEFLAYQPPSKLKQDENLLPLQPPSVTEETTKFLNDN